MKNECSVDNLKKYRAGIFMGMKTQPALTLWHVT